MEAEFKQEFIQDKAYLNQQSVKGLYVLWSRHAIQELIADNLTRKQVERALLSCEVIESYPTLHRPLPDCLALGWISASEPIHAVVAIDVAQTRIFMITVYRPDSEEWENDWKTRK